MDEARFAAMKAELSGLAAHWARLADHIKQKPLARKIIHDLRKELQAILDRHK